MKIERICRVLLAVIWVYQGLFPKLLFQSAGDLELVKSSGLFPGHEHVILQLIGGGEILFGLLLLGIGRKYPRWLHGLNIVLMILLAIASAVSQPGVFVSAFNPVACNLAMIGLSWASLSSLRDKRDAQRTA